MSANSVLREEQTTRTILCRAHVGGAVFDGTRAETLSEGRAGLVEEIQEKKCSLTFIDWLTQILILALMVWVMLGDLHSLC